MKIVLGPKWPDAFCHLGRFWGTTAALFIDFNLPKSEHQ